MLRSALCVLVAAQMLLAASGELSDRRAPGFALPDAAYEHYYDLQDYAGKVIIIDIMSTRCAHCLLAATTLEQVKERYGDKVAILEVVLPPDNQASISKFIQTNKVTVPVICDMGQMTASYFKATPATMQNIEVPHLFLVDRHGMIRNDFAYEESTRAVFEGAALFAEIDKLMK
jgi:thiol-disulfide isomerase/thioredoxin